MKCRVLGLSARLTVGTWAPTASATSLSVVRRRAIAGSIAATGVDLKAVPNGNAIVCSIIDHTGYRACNRAHAPTKSCQLEGLPGISLSAGAPDVRHEQAKKGDRAMRN